MICRKHHFCTTVHQKSMIFGVWGLLEIILSGVFFGYVFQEGSDIDLFEICMDFASILGAILEPVWWILGYFFLVVFSIAKKLLD